MKYPLSLQPIDFDLLWTAPNFYIAPNEPQHSLFLRWFFDVESSGKLSTIHAHIKNCRMLR